MERKLLLKVVSILFYVLLGLSVVFAFVFYSKEGMADLIIKWTYILAAIATVSVIAISLTGMFRSKKSIISSLIVLGIVAVLIGVSYSLSSDIMPTFFGVEEYNLTGPKLKFIDTTLFVTYILSAVAALGLIFSEVRGALK